MASKEGPDAADANQLSQPAHRRFIGALGLFLPPLVVLFAGLLPTTGLPPWRLLDSVSAYYHTGAIGIFVGVVFALSLFLFAYRGYENTAADRIVGAIGGTAALVVALSPATPDGVEPPTWWCPTMGVVHYVAAVVLFVTFVVFSVCLFRKSGQKKRSDRSREKNIRDDICLGCGLVIIASLLWAGARALAEASIFWPESVAIEAFAISWLVKGEAYRPVVDVVKRLRG